MRPHRVTCIAALFLVTLQLSSLDVVVNGRPYSGFSNRELDAIEATDRGIWLPDVLPLMISCDELTVRRADGSKTAFQDPQLAERFQNGYLKPSGSAWNLVFMGKTVRGVETLALSAELLQQRSAEVWVSWEGVPELKAEIDAFASMHACDIDVVEVPNIKTKLLTVLRARGRAPDMVMVQSDYLPELTAMRVLQPVDNPLPVAPGLSGEASFVVNERLMASPFYFDSQVVIINPAIFPKGEQLQRAVSGEWNLNDLEEAARTMKSEEVTPFCWNAYSAYWLVPFQFGFGKQRLVEHDGRVLMNDEPTILAVEYLLSLQEEGLLKVNERDAMITIFLRGDVGAILTGSFSIPSFERLGIDYIVAPYPVHPETGKPVAPVLDYKGFAITRKARNPILARRLMQYLSSPGSQIRFTSALSKLPARKDIWEELGRLHEHVEPLRVSAERGVPLPPDQSYSLFKNTMWKLLRLVFSGQMDVREALEQGQAVVDGQLTQN